MNILSFITSLEAANIPPEQIIFAMKEHLLLQKEGNRLRQKKYKENNTSVTSMRVTAPQRVTENKKDELYKENNTSVTSNSLPPHNTILTSFSLLPEYSINEEKKDQKVSVLSKMNFAALPEEWKKWSQSEFGWSDEVTQDTWQIFFEYWHNGKGKSTKREKWGATWRTWCRQQAGRVKTNGYGHSPPGSYQRPQQQKPTAKTI